MTTTKPEISGGFFIISGPTAVGKSEIVRSLRKKHPEILYSISCTTRKPRPTELDRIDYHFITQEEFEKRIQNNDFYEYEKVHDNWYGTPKTEIVKAMKSGKDVVAVLDTKGYDHVRQIAPAYVTGIFIAPPSIDDIISRIQNRGTETPEEIQKRLGNMLREFKMSTLYHHVIINENKEEIPNAIETAADKVWAIISSRRTSQYENFEFVHHFVENLSKYAVPNI